MAILNCECGYAKDIPDKYAGKRVKCPKCQNYVNIGKSKINEDTNNLLLQVDIPTKIKELLHANEQVLYASNPSRNALTLSMIVNGIVYGIIGLSLYLVGIFIVLPIALVATYYSWKNKYYVITDSRTIVAQGLF